MCTCTHIHTFTYIYTTHIYICLHTFAGMKTHTYVDTQYIAHTCAYTYTLVSFKYGGKDERHY